MFGKFGRKIVSLTAAVTLLAMLVGCSDSVIVQEEVKRRESTG